MNLDELTDTDLLDIVFSPRDDRSQAALAVIYRRQITKQGTTPHCEHENCGATNAVLYLQQLADPQMMMNIVLNNNLGEPDVNDEFKIDDFKLSDSDPFGGSFKN